MNAHAKGARAEREVADLIHQATGWPCRRRLQEGRSDDTGDLEGLPLIVAQVKDYTNPTRALLEALAQLPTQRDTAGAVAGVGLIRWPRLPADRRWVVVMGLPDLLALLQLADKP